jgi:monooxygenase
MSGVEHVDFIIIGAGLSGIGSAICLRRDFPSLSIAVLESGNEIGGTWHTFQYPGVRSDSDMYTFAYSFRPWVSTKVHADGATILRYIRETADEFDVTRFVRFQNRVISAHFNSATSKWKVELSCGKPPMTCNFLFFSVGYYNHDQGHLPDWHGLSTYSGTLLHPQKWPQDFSCKNKNIVVIGSGATAISILPSLVGEASKVRWVQRTPTYVVGMPRTDVFARFLLGMKDFLGPLYPSVVVNWLIRVKFILTSVFLFYMSRKFPEKARTNILKMNPLSSELKKQHFNPPYNVWDQRVCVAISGDLFRCIEKGEVDVITNASGIHSFDKSGFYLSDHLGGQGEHIEADAVVAATGLELQCFGKIKVVVDGNAVNPSECVINRGCFLSSVPNMAFLFGFTNASWTLRLDITMEYVRRTICRMQRQGARKFLPNFSAETNGGTTDTTELLDFNAGYIQRGIKMFPKQGIVHPWRLSQSVWEGYLTMHWKDKEDNSILYV